jgi:hypothetical protein
MFTRYLIIRSDISCIQGDVQAPSPHEAVRLLEDRLQTPADIRHDWVVYEAPRTFLPQQYAWSGADERLLNILKNYEPLMIIPRSRQ